MKTNKVSAILLSVDDFSALKKVTKVRPQAMLPFSSKYRLLDFPLSSITNANINALYMIINMKKSQSVFDHIRSGKEWNLDGIQKKLYIRFYEDYQENYRLHKHYFDSLIDFLEKTQSNVTVLLGTKTLSNIDLKDVIDYHFQQAPKVTTVFKKVPESEVDTTDALLVLNSAGQVKETRLKNKSDRNKRLPMSMSIYVLETHLLIRLLKSWQLEQNSTNVLQGLANTVSSLETAAFEYTGYLANISSIARYFQANMDMLEIEKLSALLLSSEKIHTKVKNEMPTYYSVDSAVTNCQVATGCIIEGKVTNSLISRSVLIAKNAQISHAVIMANCVIKADVILNYVILDKNTTVEAGVVMTGTADSPIVIEKNTHVTAKVGGE